MHEEYLLRMDNITKTFPGVVALDHVSLQVKKGTVHAVMGENGAGKSTLMKILFGIYHADSGDIYLKGKQCHFESPNDALKQGVAMIHQELSAVRQLTVTENIFLGKELRKKGTNFLDRSEMHRQAVELMETLHIQINPKSIMEELSVSQQQLCELVKAVSYNADLFIMDEPTSAMTESEVEHLFSIVRELTARGIAIIYITHKLDEVYQIADEVSVYRDGKYIGSGKMQEVTLNQLVEMMVGRSITQMFPKEEVSIREELLRVEGLSCEGTFSDVSFTLHRGEILGMAGLVGAGRSEVMEALFGIRKKSAGKVFIEGKEVTIKWPKDAIANKIAMLTEDRKFNGCFLPLNVSQNMIMASVKKYCAGPFLKKRAVRMTGEKMRELLSIKTPGLNQQIVNLSGGNQQKVLVGRWLLTEPEILIFDEPTRGIDVGTKSEIHKLLTQMAKEGKGIIIISSEMPEVMGMSDNIIVMHEGKVTGRLNRQEVSQEKILMLASGQEIETGTDNVEETDYE